MLAPTSSKVEMKSTLSDFSLRAMSALPYRKRFDNPKHWLSHGIG
jgi:hypothetical protein